MNLDDINRARDVIAARAVFGDDKIDGFLTQAATEARAEYISLSSDPRYGWGAALDECVKLRARNAELLAEQIRLQDEIDSIRATHGGEA